MSEAKISGDKELWDLIVNYFPAFEGEVGEENKRSLFEQVSKLIERRLALTNLKPALDLKNILAQAWYCADYDEVGDKQHKKMDEFLEDNKDFIETISHFSKPQKEEK